MSFKRQLKLISSIEILKGMQKLLEEKKKKIKRNGWVKPLLMKRLEHDLEAFLLKDLFWEEDEKDFQNFTRLNLTKFEEVLSLVHNSLEKKDTHMRAAITPRMKLCMTLRYLATGDSYKSLEFLSRISRNTIAAFVPIVLKAIYESLQPQYLKIPHDKNEWLQIAKDFNALWQFPHTLGALDGKHIRIKAPQHTGSQFYNFKGFYSIVLFASVDAHNRFTFIDVGCNGKASDNTIFQDSYLYQALHNGALNVPDKKQLVSGLGNNIDYFFIGDDAFGLDKHLMKPFNRNMKLSIQNEVFNYRICRARMVVECAFGRLANRFRIFHRPIEVLPGTVDAIILTSCVLHNYLTKLRTTPVPDIEKINVSLPKTFSSIGSQIHQTYKYASRIRDEVSRYCIAEGNYEAQWQKLKLVNNS